MYTIFMNILLFMGSLTFSLISFSVYPLLIKWLYNFINGSTELVAREDFLLSIMYMINYFQQYRCIFCTKNIVNNPRSKIINQNLPLPG